jgi:hypothetical protein
MTAKENPAPRANAESRANYKVQRCPNSSSESDRQADPAGAGLGRSARRAKPGRARPSWAGKPLRGHRGGGPIDFAEINRAALAAFPAVLARVLPGGKRVGAEIVALNPRRADRRLGSFKVNRYNGRWADFATGDKGGDPISLIAYLAVVSQGDAARLLARMLGVETGGPRNG